MEPDEKAEAEELVVMTEAEAGEIGMQELDELTEELDGLTEELDELIEELDEVTEELDSLPRI